jgi:hypothetical protein
MTPFASGYFKGVLGLPKVSGEASSAVYTGFFGSIVSGFGALFSPNKPRYCK